MSLYVDSSALTKLYVAEPESDDAATILGRESSATARHTYVEVRRALHHVLEGEDLRWARDLFEADWAEAEIVELDEATVARPRRLRSRPASRHWMRFTSLPRSASATRS